jgi:hypothetical protein
MIAEDRRETPVIENLVVGKLLIMGVTYERDQV